MKSTLLIASAIASIGLAQAAPAKTATSPTGGSQDQCVFISNIANWHVLDSRNVVVYAPTEKRAYLMQLATPISDLKFAIRVAFIDNDHDGQMCGRSPDRIIAADSFVKQPTLIQSLTRLDPAGFEALEAKYNVKLTRKKKPAQDPAGQSPAADAI